MAADDKVSAKLESMIKDRVDHVTYLPTSTAVALKFVELGRNPESDPADYAKVISSDSSLSSKLLSLANSSWFGVRNKVTKPNMAVNLLGLGTVRTLAISYCLTGLHSELRLSADESRMFWSASLCKALAAKLYALRQNPTHGEEAFAAALFQDFAIPLMFSCAREAVLPLLTDPSLSAQQRLQQERQLFRNDHAEIGRLLAQKLELPELFMDAIAFHHNPERLKEMLPEPVLANAAYLASLFPHQLNAWNRQDADELKNFLAAQTKPIDCAEFLGEVQEEFNRMYAFFEQGQVPETKLMELLQEATKEAAANTERLVGTVQELMQRAVTGGGLPGFPSMAPAAAPPEAPAPQPAPAAPVAAACAVLDRNKLGADVAALAKEALVTNQAFACLALYIGAPEGGIALDPHDIADQLRPQARPQDIFGRLADDGLIVVMPSCNEAEAKAAAENFLKMITAAAAEVPGAEDPPRVGAGVLWMNPNGGVFATDKMLGGLDWLLGQARGGPATRVHSAKITGKAKATA